MKKQLSINWRIICLASMLVSCSMDSSSLQIPSTTTSINEPSFRTVTSTNSPTLTATLSPTDTNTPTPSKTNTLIPNTTIPPNHTPTFSPATVEALATLDTLVTAIPELGEYYSWDCLLYPCYTSGLGISPNKEWAVFYNFKGSGGLQIVSIDGDKKWEIYYSELQGITCPPCGNALVEIKHWSKDGKYLYISPNMMGDGGYDWLWREEEKLFRMNLENGTWVDTRMGSSFSFSPNDRYITYRSNEGVQIFEFKTGELISIPLSHEYNNFGHFVWSPDSQQIIFSAAEEGLEEGMNHTGLSVFLINLENMSTEMIFEHDLRFIYPDKWHEPMKILFESLYGYEDYQLDLETGTITLIDRS